MPAAAAVAAAVVVAVVSLAGCSRAAPVSAGPGAADPSCARVLVQLPDELRGEGRRETTGQSTAAWGDPPVELRCGVEPLGPTTDPCLPIGDVDWVFREDGDDTTYTTYGRLPAVEVRLPGLNPPGADEVLTSVSDAVSFIPAERRCL